MRRTYKSKKDTRRELDSKDPLFTCVKNADFDAFYIKNIKQTNLRSGTGNLQCLPISKRTRKKYVKRIIQDVEPSFTESVSRSTYLTPDKSIHVNKAPDLFDQLLNSTVSPECKPVTYTLPMLQLKNKNITHSQHVINRINCSTDSEDSDGNKENKNDEYILHKTAENSKDLTDFLTYELMIEKENVKCNPTDDSINNLVLDTSLMKRVIIKHNTEQLSNNVTKCIKLVNNRLTESLASENRNSPLTSTPFSQKYRGKSIYNFSPIPMYNLDQEESSSCDNDLKDGSEDKYCSTSPKQNNSATQSMEVNKISNHSTSMILSSKQSSSLHNIHEKSMEQKVQSMQTLDVSTTFIPFLGFSSNEENNVMAIQNIHTSSKINNTENINLSVTSLEFADIEEEIEQKDDSLKLKFNRDLLKNIDAEVDEDNVRECDIQNREHNLTNILEYQISQSQNENYSKESFYDANCSSFDRFENVESQKNSFCKELSDKMLDCSSDNEVYSNEAESIHRKHNDNERGFKICNNSSYIEAIETELDYKNDNVTPVDDINKFLERSTQVQDPELSNDSFIENSDDEGDNDKNKFISFVTTRRHRHVTFNTSIYSLNDSGAITSSNECEKTVLNLEDANNKKSGEPKNICEPYLSDDDVLESSDYNDRGIMEQQNNKLKENTVITNQDVDTDIISQCDANVRHSLINTSSDFHRPSIVLQPGKQWERSLSIYKRMTCMNDNLDLSILDEESYTLKGRKYRQSVINTMEMQEHRGSVYNKPHVQQRSTIVPKLCKPTVKIIAKSNSSRVSLCSTRYDDISGFLSEDCDDTLIELSKLSIADAENDITVLEKQDTSERLTTARDYVLRRCNQTEVVLFDECYPETVLKNCRKIGEGVYGEVFLWRGGDGRARVLKVVPVAGSTRVNGEQQKEFDEIISEIVIAMELSALRSPIADIEKHFDEGQDISTLDLHSIENATDAFNEVLAVKCVYGSYPSRLLDLWYLYDECKGSENDNPAILPIDQQYIVLELANAGQDLESYQFNSAEQAYALFIQVALALAVGEEAYQFEHRDLHWGNVLISPTDQKFGTFVVRGRALRAPRCGVRATVIDYSLSRLSLPLGEDHADHAALYNDLAHDEGLFDAVGDYQFQVYRLMRDKLGNDWKNFEPYTNILWLHYTVDKMITALRYKRTNTKIHKQYINKLKGIKNRILNYGSTVQFVLTDNEY